MAADYLTFRRATSASILGLILQAAMAIGLAIYGVLARDHGALSISVYAAIGCIAWLALAIIYDQHRRERMEAVEAEAFSTSELAGTSAFSTTGDEFRPAAKRLRALYKVFLPLIGNLIAALLIGLGVWRNFISTRVIEGPGGTTQGVASAYIPPDPSIHPGWGLGLGVAIAAIAFVFARYAATMARQKDWAALRAGAGFAAGTALFSIALAIGHAIDFGGTNQVARLMGNAVAVATVILGAEVVLNLILDLYRPRRAGETPRPAFDSRLLGLLAAPDRIAQSVGDAVAYQLGFDVSRGWLYLLLRKWVLPLIAVGTLIMWLLTSLAVVQPHQRAVVLRFGAPVGDELGPGLYFKYPWPIDTLYVPEFIVRDSRGRSIVQDLTATGLRRIELATSPPANQGAILWTNDHLGTEVFQFVRSSPITAAGTRPPAFDDLAAVSVEIPLQYVVDDVRLFDQLAPPALRDDILAAVGRREVLKFFQDKSLTEVLSGDRTAKAAALRARIEAAFAQLNPGPDGVPRGSGVRVVSLTFSGVHPPKETATAFETIVQADQRREANIAAARADAARTLTEVVGDVTLANAIVTELDALNTLRSRNAPPDEIATQEFRVRERLQAAGGTMSSLLAEAAADRWERHMGERGRATRYQGQVALADASPLLYRVERYFEARQRMLSRARIYFVTSDTRDLRIDLNLENKDTGLDVFRPKEEVEE